MDNSKELFKINEGLKKQFQGLTNQTLSRKFV